jgi:hypothetical protein
MGYLQRDVITYGSTWLAMVAMLVGTFYALRSPRSDNRLLFVDGAVLHAHADVVHAHRNGEAAHLHTTTGEQVPIRR